MPPTDLTESLLSRLRAGTASSSELEQAFALSQSSVARALRTLGAEGRVVRIGTTRGARYGLRRSIENAGSHWPLRQVDRRGAVHELATVHALAPDM